MLSQTHASAVWLLLVLGGGSVNVGFVSVSAEKDSDYHFPGFVNPNTKNKMYWKDSVNVLQDLDQFDALYIQYHGCIWSKYGSRYGSGEDYDEQGQDQDDAEENSEACGGWGGEYFWYMGRTQCFKAQVAYSLYGVLKGTKAVEKHGSLCHKKSYINSFFTTFGVESFAGPLGLDVDTYNSECAAEEPQNGEGNNEEYYEWAAADDDYLDDNFEFVNYAAYTSSGMGCSAKGKFVTDQYKGAFCHGRNYLETLDTLDSFNQAVESMECTQIYDSSNNNNNRRRTEEEEYKFDEMDAVQILSFSKSCSLRQYPNDCPDPYGLKNLYSNRMNRAMEFTTGRSRYLGIKLMRAFTHLSVLGGALILLATYIMQRRVMQATSSGKGSSTPKRTRKRRNRRNKAIMIESKQSSETELTEVTNKRRNRALSPKRNMFMARLKGKSKDAAMEQNAMTNYADKTTTPSKATAYKSNDVVTLPVLDSDGAVVEDNELKRETSTNKASPTSIASVDMLEQGGETDATYSTKLSYGLMDERPDEMVTSKAPQETDPDRTKAWLATFIKPDNGGFAAVPRPETVDLEETAGLEQTLNDVFGKSGWLFGTSERKLSKKEKAAKKKAALEEGYDVVTKDPSSSESSDTNTATEKDEGEVEGKDKKWYLIRRKSGDMAFSECSPNQKKSRRKIFKK